MVEFPRHAWLTTTCALCALALAGVPSAQQPTFRSGVDLIAVEAQVVDGNGNPIALLKASDFDVSLQGRRRRVASADLVRLDDSRSTAASLPGGAGQGGAIGEGGRTFMLAVDTSSFEVGAARRPVEAAQRFVSQLLPEDRVGLHAYPVGPSIPPGTARAAVRQALGTILGDKHQFGGVYHLQPSEIVDITGAIGGANPGGLASRTRTARNPTAAEIEASPVLAVQARECPDDPECATRIISEASAVALHLESQAARSLGGLDALLESLAAVPGRKTVVLITAGVVVSDRPGGRPDVGDWGRVMGQQAARARAVVYTIHIDPGFSGMYSAARRRAGETERTRDRNMSGDWLDRFSASAGGMRIQVPVGAGEFAFDRVLRETAAFYLLGVEPAAADRDGRPRELRLKVNKPGVTVRSRQWVVVPKTTGAVR